MANADELSVSLDINNTELPGSTEPQNYFKKGEEFGMNDDRYHNNYSFRWYQLPGALRAICNLVRWKDSQEEIMP